MLDLISVSIDNTHVSMSIFEYHIFTSNFGTCPAPLDLSVQTDRSITVDLSNVDYSITVNLPSTDKNIIIDRSYLNNIETDNYLIWDRMWEIYPYVKYPLILIITGSLCFVGLRHISNLLDGPAFVSVNEVFNPHLSMSESIPNLEGWITQNYWFDDGVSRHVFSTGIRSDYFSIGYMNNNLDLPMWHYFSINIHHTLMSELIGIPMEIGFAYDLLYNSARLFYFFV